MFGTWNIGGALRALAMVVVAALLSISGASAQSGNPIKVGVGLALTGAGASPSKVILTSRQCQGRHPGPAGAAHRPR